jgi:hypothetical protein
MKPTLKAPGAKRLKLEYDEPPSSFAFKFSLRRYRPGLGYFFHPLPLTKVGRTVQVDPILTPG